MAQRSSNRIDAYNELKSCLGEIKVIRVENQRNHHLPQTLNPSKDFQMIRCQEKYDGKVREEFNKNMVDGGRHRIEAKGSTCTTRYDSVQPRVKGTKLHTTLSNEINHLETEVAATALSPEKQWFTLLHDFLKEKFKVSLLRSISKVPLRGYAVAVENLMPNCYFWSGEANAIGLLKVKEGEYKYVIVKWIIQEKPDFWESSKYPTLPYRQYLHQSLVYARLLKMYMRLGYWPPILLVPIGPNGEYMHPRLFTDYPDKCKNAIEKYQWSTNPSSVKFKKGPLFKDTREEVLLQGDMKLKDVLKDDATVDDLSKYLKFCRISVED